METRFVAVVVWLIGIIVIFTGARDWFPALASDHGAGIDLMLHYILYCVGGLLIIGHTVLGWFLWSAAKRKQITFRKAEHAVERKWSLIPMAVMALVAEGGVMVIGLPAWAKIYGPPPKDAMTIEITAEQFAWNVRYPGKDGIFGKQDLKFMSLDNPLGIDEKDPAGIDDTIGVNSIHVPVNKPVKIRLRSKDVIHSFFLPHLRVKQDAMPGMTIEIWFVPTKIGKYELACAELCGFGHSEMGGLLTVESEEDFNTWLKEMSNG